MFKFKEIIFKIFKIFLGRYYYSFLLKLMHLKKNTFKGYSLRNNIHHINEIIKNHNIESLLDYGCGKALEYNPNPYNKSLEIFLYDPFYKRFNLLPKKQYDLVVCTDVMEHVEKTNINNVLNHINSFSNRAVFFSISTNLAKKNLPDGQNAHVTILSDQEWKNLIKKNFSEKISIYVKFNENSEMTKI